MRSRRWPLPSCTTLSVLAVAACGGTDARHDALERELLKVSVGICDGDCREYHATEATCDQRSHRDGGLAFRSCRVTYANRDERFSETICAALDRDGHERAAPKRYCR